MSASEVMCTGPYKAEVAFKVMDMLIILMLSLSNQNISLYFINTYEYVCIKKKNKEKAGQQNQEPGQEASQAQMISS